MKTVRTNSQQLINILTECVKKSFGLNEGYDPKEFSMSSEEYQKIFDDAIDYYKTFSLETLKELGVTYTNTEKKRFDEWAQAVDDMNPEQRKLRKKYEWTKVILDVLTHLIRKKKDELGIPYFKLHEKRNVRSQKLFDMIEKHGKPRAYYIDLQSLTDDDILVVNEDGTPLTRAKMKEYDKEFGPVEKITFDDDSYIICKYKYNSDYGNKLGDRWANHNKLDGKREYRWKNDEAQDLIFKNPYFRKEWEKKYQDKAIDNVKNKRSLHAGFDEL